MLSISSSQNQNTLIVTLDGRIDANSVAAKAGLKPDDLVLFINDRAISSRKVLLEELTFIDRLDEVRLVVQRGQELVEVTLVAPDKAE